MSLKDKLISGSTIKYTAGIADSKVYGKKELVTTRVPIINAALSGTLDGGLAPGLTMLAGPSKHFKTGFSLLLAEAFLNKYKDGIVLFYDSEFGTPENYFEQFKVDIDRVVHTPIMNVEELKFDIMKQLDQITVKDNVLIIIDRIGNLASKKEVDDAMDGKSVADMSRAKQMKSLFRMVTPHLNMKNIPMVVVNHTYKEIGLFPKDIVSGGTGGYYSSDTIWILGRQQDKDGKAIQGYHFIINVEKSRYVKEKSKIPVSVSWESGINKWSGFLELALEHGSVVKTKPGWYAATGSEKALREKQIISNDEFWQDLLSCTTLAKFIQEKYQIGGKGDQETIIDPEDIE